MADFSDDEVIRGSELRADPVLADVKFLRGGYSRLVQTSAQHSELLTSMATAIREVQQSVSQLSKQLGKRPIMADFDVTESSDQAALTFLCGDSSRSMTDEHMEKIDSMEALLREMKQAPSIAMPEFDASNVYDWVSKVERFFRVRRYSDLDKLNLVAFSLEGAVLNWFNWEMTRREFRSWDEFRRRLLLRFGAAPENRLLTIKQTGTVSAHVTELEELSAQVIEQQTVYKEDSITQLQVPVSKWEHSLQIHNESPNVCENYKDVVGGDELSTVEKMFSGLSQISQVWEPGGVLASVNVADSLGEKASYTEKKLILQYQEMDSTNGTRVDVESANGANGANGDGDIDALLPPPPILPPNVEPLHVKTEPVEKMNLRVPMARQGFGPKGQRIPLLTNHFKVDVADLQGHFYHYSVGCAHKERLTLKSKRKLSLSLKTWRFKFKKRHKWKSKLLLHSSFDGTKLTELDFHLSENHSQDKTNGLLVFPWNLMILQFFLFIHLEDKVCLSGASNSCSGWLQGLLETRIGLTVEIAGLLEVVCVLAACMMHDATVISAKLPETIRGIELVTDSGQLKAVLAQIIQGTDEAYTKIIDKLQIKLKQGMDLLGESWHCSTDEMTQFHSPIGLVDDTLVDALHSGLGEKVHTLLAAEVLVSAPGQQKSSSIWHRWRRKD